jgi:hypothetical protein
VTASSEDVRAAKELYESITKELSGLKEQGAFESLSLLILRILSQV